MGAPEILGHLMALGLTAKADGGRLLVEPRDAITDEVRELIRTNKQAILSALNPAMSPRVELMGLIKVVGTLYAYEPSAFEEATQVAFAKPQEALVSYRDVAKRYGLNVPTDDRVTCAECSRLVKGRCQAAKMGLMENTQPDYSPGDVDLAHRCAFFKYRGV